MKIEILNERPMLTPVEAQTSVIACANPLQARSFDPIDAQGLVLAETIAADRDYPPFPRSMMDGFAVRLSDAGRMVPIVGEIPAGTVWQGDLCDGQCLEILTGAPCPASAEAVVPKELVERTTDAVRLPENIRPGQHIAPQGSDCRRGGTIVAYGDTITPMAIAAMVSVGRNAVMAIPRPTMAIITTGGELTQGDQTPAAGQIRNSNGPMLRAFARQLGLADPLMLHAEDRLEDIVRALEEAGPANIVVLTGGVSVGTYDLVPAALTRCGATTVFHGVSQKPGKPLLFAEKPLPQASLIKQIPDPRNDNARRQLFFGLPGNPLSSHFCFHRYVATAIRRMSLRHEFHASCVGRLIDGLEWKGGRTQFLPGWATKDEKPNGSWNVALRRTASSADIFSGHQANCYVEIPPRERAIQAGDACTFTWL